jgi:predicted phosphodiesterase
MKLGVMSDSHDHLGNIGKAVAAFTERRIGSLIHGGDMCSPFVFRQLEALREFCPGMYAVFGNNLHKSGDFDLVIYGHSHQVRVEGGDRVLLNPGSCAGYLTEKATIAVVDLVSLEVELIDLD